MALGELAFEASYSNFFNGGINSMIKEIRRRKKPELHENIL